jgi:hypothetical protein
LLPWFNNKELLASLFPFPPSAIDNVLAFFALAVLLVVWTADWFVLRTTARRFVEILLLAFHKAQDMLSAWPPRLVHAFSVKQKPSA